MTRAAVLLITFLLTSGIKQKWSNFEMQLGHGLLHPPEARPNNALVAFASIIFFIALEITTEDVSC